MAWTRSTALIACMTLGCAGEPPCVPTEEIGANGIDEDCNGIDDIRDGGAVYAYVLSSIDTSAADGAVYGFDRDGRIGGEAGLACTNVSDFTSRLTGVEGVDNQVSRLEALLDVDLAAAIGARFRAGALLVVRASSVDSTTNDSWVPVDVTSAETLTGDAPATSGTELAPGQVLRSTSSLGTSSSAIVQGRLSFTFPSLPIGFDLRSEMITLTLHDVHIEGSISASGYADVELGASLDVAELVALGLLDRETIETAGLADLEPDASGDHCAAISIGMGLTMVAATLQR